MKTIKYVIIDIAENDENKLEFVKKIVFSRGGLLSLYDLSPGFSIYIADDNNLVTILKEHSNTLNCVPGYEALYDNILFVSDFCKHAETYYYDCFKNLQFTVHVIGINLTRESKNIAEKIAKTNRGSYCDITYVDEGKDLSDADIKESLSELYKHFEHD
jgi:hypothetical protein